jgi:hypothetical protein
MTNHQRIKTRRSTANRIISTIWYSMERSWWTVVVIYAVVCAMVIAANLGTP